MRKTLRINSILSGQAPSRYFGAEGTFDQSLGIDPDFPIVGSAIRTSGFAVPIGMADFTGANLTAKAVSIITNPKNELVYVVTSDGKLISYTSALASETLVGTVTGNVAKSAVYYNNYIYIFTGTDVSRYGPLNNSPTLVDSVWTGSTLGTQTALTNTTYPTFNSVSIPNHIGHVHGDNSLYFTDFINGQGQIHRINTKKVTSEGDTNGTTVPSAYSVLDLPFGFYPTAIESMGTLMIILGNYSSSGTVNQGKSAFVIWNTTNTVSFSEGPVFLADPLATALLNVNGTVYIWSGNGQAGFRLSRYSGGESVTDIAFFEEGFPPFATAVDAIGNKIIWGGTTTTPAVSACVWSYRSKDSRMPEGIHNIVKTTSAGATPVVSALKYVLQANNAQPRAIVAWNDATTCGVDAYSATGTLGSYLRWTFNIGRKFNILEIRIPFGGKIEANTTITPKIWFDGLSSSKSPTVINNTNYPGSKKIIYKTPELKDYIGENDCTLEFCWTGTNPLPIAFPILLEIDILSDESDR